MTVIGIDNEEDVEDFLAHFGVKGMRWGHRKAQDSGSASPEKSAKKKYTKEEIQSARARDASRVHEINNQVARTNLAKGKQLDKEVKKLANMQADYLRSPDRATALRMTKGEKWGLVALGLGSNLVAPGVGTIGVGGFAAARVARRKATEKDVAIANAAAKRKKK